MSPEQAEDKPVDARSDIFGFGAVLYEGLAGHRAFTGDSIALALSAVLRDEPAPSRHLRNWTASSGDVSPRNRSNAFRP